MPTCRFKNLRTGGQGHQVTDRRVFKQYHIHAARLLRLQLRYHESLRGLTILGSSSGGIVLPMCSTHCRFPNVRDCHISEGSCKLVPFVLHYTAAPYKSLCSMEW